MKRIGNVLRGRARRRISSWAGVKGAEAIAEAFKANPHRR
jgi:hypothetical protein